MTEREGLERVLRELLEPLGVVALGRDAKVIANPDTNGYTVRLSLPQRRYDVVIECEDLTMSGADVLLKKLETGARILFADTVEHIAKHDRSPIDRVKDIEAAATALLDTMQVSLSDVRMPHSSSAVMLDAAHRLRMLLKQKPGAAAWGRKGYGAAQAIADAATGRTP